QRIAGIGRQRDNAAAAHDLRRLCDKTRLRVIRMNLKKLAHGNTAKMYERKRKRRRPDDRRRPFGCSNNNQRALRNASIRSWIGGWLENSAMKPGRSVMPNDARFSGNG